MSGRVYSWSVVGGAMNKSGLNTSLLTHQSVRDPTKEGRPLGGLSGKVVNPVALPPALFGGKKVIDIACGGLRCMAVTDMDVDIGPVEDYD